MMLGERLLLVLLFIGVVAAALWALFSNGVFSPGSRPEDGKTARTRMSRSR